MGKIIGGADEAGRGPLVGPLVVAGVTINEKDLPKLVDLGVKDSKMHSPLQRERLYKEIIKIVREYIILKVPAQEIDSKSFQGINLNKLEALEVSEVLDKLSPDIAYIDSPTAPNGAFFETLIREFLKNQNITIYAGHKYDSEYPIVSAASILAKVTRDREILKIEKEIGENIGSGYPSDPRTINFIKNRKDDKIIKYVRKTWSTWDRLNPSKNQKSLSDF